jgi:hypothetical protein
LVSLRVEIHIHAYTSTINVYNSTIFLFLCLKSDNMNLLDISKHLRYYSSQSTER